MKDPSSLVVAITILGAVASIMSMLTTAQASASAHEVVPFTRSQGGRVVVADVVVTIVVSVVIVVLVIIFVGVAVVVAETVDLGGKSFILGGKIVDGDVHVVKVHG